MEINTKVGSDKMAYWNPLRGVRDPIPIRQFMGVYSNDDDGFSLPDGYAQDMRNISSLSYPAVSLKPGFSILGSSLSNRVTGLAAWKSSELNAIASGTWSKWNGTAWSAVSGGSGLNSSSDCSFANFKGNLSSINLLMANGVDAPRRYDGSTVQLLNGAPANGNYIEQHDNRCYLAVENIVHFSALAKPEDWSTAKDAGQIGIETNDGQTIIGMKSGNQRLTVFKKSSIYELYGTGPANYKLQQITDDIGAYCNKAIINVAGVLYFISNRIYRYSGGTRPEWEFSKPVQNYLNSINQAAVSKCVAGTNGRNIYFAIPYGTSTECNMILEFDTMHNVWYVWDNTTATQFARIGNNWYQGNVSGQVLQMGVGDNDNGVATSWKWVSPPYSSDNLIRRINWYNLYAFIDLPIGSTFSVYVSKQASGDSDWFLLKSMTASSNIQSSRVIIPLSVVALSNFIRVKFEGTGPFRMFEFDRQMREMPFK